MVQQLGDDEFYKALEEVGLRPRNAPAAPFPQLSDTAYDRITKLLELRGRREWKWLTRTFTVLHQCGLEHFMGAFSERNRTDYSLPYTQDSLPDALVGEERRRFLAYQEHVLVSDGARIERGKSKHLHLRSSADELFFFGRLLGSGSFAQVTQVTGKTTFKDFALKKVRRCHFDHLKDSKSLQSFKQELETLQLLKHEHIVNLIGSFTDNKYLGLLMEPVADENLGEFLERQTPVHEKAERCRRLRGFFGCIAAAICYLHNNKNGQVLHKDIKPANILVKAGKVYIADFGAAALRVDAFSDALLESTVNSTNRLYTPKYMAPEAAYATRTSASDIWSLGCVFIEMLTVLAGRDIHEIEQFLQSTGADSTTYHRRRAALDVWIEELRDALIRSWTPRDAQLVDVVKLMCTQEPAKRIEARDLFRRLCNLEGLHRYYGICCAAQDVLSIRHGVDWQSVYTSNAEDDSNTDQHVQRVLSASAQDVSLNLQRPTNGSSSPKLHYVGSESGASSTSISDASNHAVRTQQWAVTQAKYAGGYDDEGDEQGNSDECADPTSWSSTSDSPRENTPESGFDSYARDDRQRRRRPRSVQPRDENGE